MIGLLREGECILCFACTFREIITTDEMLHQRWTLEQNWDLRLEYDLMDEISEGNLSLNYYR